MTIQELLTAERAKDWKRFVADYVVLMTRKKDNRALVAGYQVKKVKNGYQIVVNGVAGLYEVMNPETLYSWMERLALRYFALEADNWRYDLLSTQATTETRILHTFGGIDAIYAEVAKIATGYSVAVRDGDVNQHLPTVKTFKTELEAASYARDNFGTEDERAEPIELKDIQVKQAA